jgi:hypothetical protein
MSVIRTWSISTSGAEIIRLVSVISEYVNTIRHSTLPEFIIFQGNNPADLSKVESDISNMLLHVNSVGSILLYATRNIVKIAAAAESKSSCIVISGENKYLFEPTDLIYTEMKPLRKLHRMYMVTRYDILNPTVAISGYLSLLRTMHQKNSLKPEQYIRLQNALEHAYLKINNSVTLLRPVFDTTMPFDKRRELVESSFPRFLQSDLPSEY